MVTLAADVAGAQHGVVAELPLEGKEVVLRIAIFVLGIQGDANQLASFPDTSL